MNVRILPVATVFLLGACSGRPPAPAELPPPVRAEVTPTMSWSSVTSQSPHSRREPIIEKLFGKDVADPYRWLENESDPEVQRWTEIQNQYLERLLARVPYRQTLLERLRELTRIGDISRPDVRRSETGSLQLFFARREGAQNQPALHLGDPNSTKSEILIDPNRLDPNGGVSLDWFYPSRDGSLIAYGLSEQGSEESTLRVFDVRTRSHRPDVISRTRHASVCFAPDGKSFYYSRYPARGSVPASEQQYHRRIYQHVLGTDPERDPLVFRADNMTDYPSCEIAPNGRWLVVEVHQGWSKSELYLSDTRQTPRVFRRLTSGLPHQYETLARDDALWVKTNEGAPRGALYRVDPNAPDRANWRMVLPEHASDVLSAWQVISGQIVAVYLQGAATRIERFTVDGKSLGPVALPVVGNIEGISGVADGREAFFDFQSFAVAPSIRRLDLTTGASQVWQAVSSGIDPNEFQVDTGVARSRDGTKVPFSLVRRRDLDLTRGPVPTVLWGYGGFNLSVLPRFSRSNIALFERGVVFVQANLRGGGEFGESWHQQGQLGNKQNVFDDYIAVAEELIRRRYTSPSKLAAMGRSNGGLLVAAAVTQRPDLFRAAVSGVPLTDMLRYDRFKIAKLWVPEYGDPANPEHFPWLLRYSPYHHVQTGVRYPAVLVTTAASDTRVDPMHARKFVAALQHASRSSHPVALRLETGAGHGAGKPVTRLAQEHADVFSFLLSELDVSVGSGSQLHTASVVPETRSAQKPKHRTLRPEP